MMPSSNQGLGMNIGFPDVCLTPAAPSPVPVPYPNLGQNAVAMPFCPTILLAGCPAHNMGAKPQLTNGDEAGAAHATFIGTGANNMGNPKILLQGMPAETLCNPTAGNKYNNPLGSKLVPSLTNCLMGAAPGAGAWALAAEVCDAPGALAGELGLTLERERGGWRVLHARRGGRAARAGVRPGALLMGAGPQGLELRGGRRARVVSLPAAAARGPVSGRVLPGGVGLLVLRRCSFGAPRAVDEALRGLASAGARTLVLDLRGNPGGALEVHELLAAKLAPTVVLVDGGTASAAELLAATLAERGAALAGTPTHGKLHARAHAFTPAGLVPHGPALRMRTPSGAQLCALRPSLSLAAGLALAGRLARRQAG